MYLYVSDMAGEEGKDGKWREEKEQDIQALSEELPFIQASGQDGVIGTRYTLSPEEKKKKKKTGKR